MPFPRGYHTSSTVLAEIEALLPTCKQPMSVELDALVPWVRIGNSSDRKAFILAGEHARELVPVEVSLALVKSLCTCETPLATTWMIVPLANRGGRAKVEAGDFCWRANENGVDINRNWQSGSSSNFRSSETYGGDHAFSEPETAAIRDLVTQFSPEIFISVHSGFQGILVPWASASDSGGAETSERQRQMLARVQPWRERLCPSCAVGEARDVLHYDSPGTCLDWVFKNVASARLTLAVEVFQGPQDASCVDLFNPREPEPVVQRWVELVRGLVTSN